MSRLVAPLLGTTAGLAASALVAGALGWGRGERTAAVATGRDRIPREHRGPVRARLWPSTDAPYLHWLGHSGFLLSWHGLRVVVDPHLGPRCSVARRTSERPLPARAWPPVDAALVSHAHLDHLDPATLRAAGPGEVLAPAGSERWTRGLARTGADVHWLEPGESRTVGRLVITAVEARHHGSRLHPLRSRELAVGWVVGDGDSVLYFAGDTGAGDHFARIREAHRPRVAVLPIGAWAPRIPLRWFHLSPGEAVAAAVELGVELAVPAHFGTFRLSADAPDRALPRFAEAASREGLPWVMAPLLRSPRGAPRSGRLQMRKAGRDVRSAAGRLAASCERRPRVVIGVWLALTLLGLILGSGLELRTSNLDLVDPEQPPVARFREVLRELGNPSPITVVVSGEDPDRLGAIVDRLGPRLRRIDGVESVFDRLPIDPDAARVLGVDPFLRSRDGGLAFLFVQPEDREMRVEVLGPVVGRIRDLVDEVASEEPGVELGLTGMPVYAVDDRDNVQRDLGRLGLLSLVGVLTIFVLGFGRVRRPLAATASLLPAVAATLGFAALWPGHLTLLSAFFASILFGLGIDFGIHVVDRWEQLEGRGVADPGALAVDELARPLVAGAGTTASVLAGLSFAGFRGFAELGVIAAVGVVLSLLAAITLLPALLAGGGVPDGNVERPRARRILPPRSVLAGLGIAVLGLAAIGLDARPRFDRDYLALQPADSPAVRWERETVERSDWSPEIAVFLTDDEEEMEELTWALLQEEVVGEVRSIRTLGSLGGMAGVLPPGAEEAAAALRTADGRFAVQAAPAGDFWDPNVARAFRDRMVALDPEVTGLPILGEWMIDRSLRAFRIAGLLGAGLLVGWVAISFRRPLPTLLALVPTALTVAGLAGAMRLLGLSFNSLSVMGAPVLLGLAVDDGVHLVHGFLESRGRPGVALARAGRSVTLTSATTLVAFGSLGLAEHRGLASFGIVVALGTVIAWAATVGVLPGLLAIARPLLGVEPESTDRSSRGRSSRLRNRSDAFVARASGDPSLPGGNPFELPTLPR